MTETQKAIVVAFDGMDYELIQKYGLDLLDLEEFGKIDNSTGIKSRYTSELFASFITGKTSEDHGIVKLVRSDKNKVKRLLRQGLVPEFLANNIRGFWRLNRLTKRFFSLILSIEDLKYDKSDLKTETLFEEIDLSKPLFVPSYNPDLRWQLKVPHKMAQVGEVEDVREYSKKLTRSRLSDFQELSFEFWDFIMLHLHDPDGVQDVKLGDYRQDYQRLDKIATEILENVADEKVVIFMSDHGMMEEKQHNKNAFYACNKELFGDTVPHITDFHDKILEITGKD